MFEIVVTGMSCGGCVKSVKKAVERVPGVTGAEVDLESGKVKVEGEAAPEAVKKAVEVAGYGVA